MKKAALILISSLVAACGPEKNLAPHQAPIQSSTETAAKSDKNADLRWQEHKWKSAKNRFLEKRLRDHGSLIAFIRDYPDSKHVPDARALLESSKIKYPATLPPNQPGCLAQIQRYAENHVKKTNDYRTKRHQENGAELLQYDFNMPENPFSSSSTMELLPRNSVASEVKTEDRLHFDLIGRFNYDQSGNFEKSCSLTYRFSGYGQGLPQCTCDLAYAVTEKSKLLSKLGSQHKTLRDNTVRELIDTNASDSNLVLAEILREGHGFQVSHGAAKVLSEVKDTATAELLIDTLRSGATNDKSQAAMVLGALQDRRAVEPMLSILAEKDDSMLHNGLKMSVNRALAKIKDPRALPVLQELADNHDNQEVRSTAAFAIKAINEG
ncbi:HEAT repeat domain-containing protein [Pelagibius sp. Alg239-R121]|uniref:HEAT repeat domain-containing protein n=1 Tax=Pelagibius sp. Alg239-R121 TaxID=2993448 RepID=UPI0024A677D7|nr:HEAT repeat domain-containing protein [Pelagibius sp. Alg239-R121]